MKNQLYRYSGVPESMTQDTQDQSTEFPGFSCCTQGYGFSLHETKN